MDNNKQDIEFKVLELGLSEQVERYLKVIEWSEKQMKERLRKDNEAMKKSAPALPTSTIKRLTNEQ